MTKKEIAYVLKVDEGRLHYIELVVATIREDIKELLNTLEEEEKESK